jgi:hypothetical protein
MSNILNSNNALDTITSSTFSFPHNLEFIDLKASLKACST